MNDVVHFKWLKKLVTVDLQEQTWMFLLQVLKKSTEVY